MSNYYDLASELPEPPSLATSSTWRERISKNNGPTYYFFASPEIVPFTQAAHKNTATVWPLVASYCEARAADRTNIQDITEADDTQGQWPVFINLCRESKIDPWQACKAMPLFAGDSGKAAAHRLTDSMYGNEKVTPYLGMSRDAFFAKAIAHFEEIPGIDITTGMKIAPKRQGDLLRLCRVRLLLSHNALGKKVGYAKNSISLIENHHRGIALKKIDNFVETLGLTGKSRNIFLDLYGYRSPQSCTYDMSQASTVGAFLTAAEERLRLTTAELAAQANINIFVLHHVKSNAEKLPKDIAPQLEKALNLTGAEAEQYYALVKGQYPSQNHTYAMISASCIGDFLAAARKRISFNQDRLALVLGYKNRSTISTIEQGLENIPQKSIDDFAFSLHLKGKEQTVFLRLIKEFNVPEKRRSRKIQAADRQEIQPIELAI